MRFITQVAGVTCQCERMYAPSREFDCALYTLDGYVDMGLMLKITPEDTERLFDEYKAADMAQRHGVEY